MRIFIGQLPYAHTLREYPTAFGTDDYVTVNESGLIGRIVYPFVAQRAYGIVYKYLVLIDHDLCIFEASDLMLYSRG